METDPGVRGGGRVRRVVAWGKQGGDDGSFQACRMKAVRGRVSVRTEWNVVCYGLCECAWEGVHPQHCHRDAAPEQGD